jgi:ribonucleoside-diphosphate reductase alpha chain
MGFHSYLQKHGIAWESETASVKNIMMFDDIKTKSVEQSKLLASARGEYLDGIGTGLRHAHLLAIAPNASSGIILSTSPSIEPLKANAFTHRTRAGSFLVQNNFLKKVLKKYEKDNDKTWSSIITNKGSVQHLNFLSHKEKAIFKTAQELDQMWVVRHAAERQKYICQGQSVNLFFPSGCNRSYVNKVHLSAWEKGLKGLYYLRTEAKSRAETVSDKVERIALEDYKGTVIYGKDDCPFCEMTKEEFLMRGIEFEFIDLKEIGKTAAEVTGRDVKTIPQIYYNGIYVGGYEDLMAKLQNGITLEEGDECRACEG